MGILTDDILTYAQLNNRNQPTEEVNLSYLLKFVEHNLEETIRERQAIITADDLPAITGYRALLTQLFQNIIHNALKFRREGDPPQIIIRTATEAGRDIKRNEAAADATYLRISFTDNGIGFDKKDRERIFEMFYRLHHGERYPGTGIGLSICRKIAEMHQGFIIAESSPDEGSTFHVYLDTSLSN